MENTETVYILEDVVPYFERIIDIQNTEIERLQDITKQLETQTELQQEMINGFELVVNYQFATVGLIAIISVIILCWRIFNKWFFRGV